MKIVFTFQIGILALYCHNLNLLLQVLNRTVAVSSEEFCLNKVLCSLLDTVKWMKEVAEIRILSVKRLPLVTLALGDQALGDDAKLLAVSQRLPVGVGGSCHKERVDL